MKSINYNNKKLLIKKVHLSKQTNSFIDLQSINTVFETNKQKTSFQNGEKKEEHYLTYFWDTKSEQQVKITSKENLFAAFHVE